MSDDLAKRLETVAAVRLRSEPFEDKKNYMNVYARMSRADGALMAEAAVTLRKTEEKRIDDELIESLARRSYTACLSYYDGKNKPLDDPMGCHRHLVRAILSGLASSQK